MKKREAPVSDTSKLTLLGSARTEYRYENPEASMLEVFDNQHPTSAWVVGLECTEFTSLCPMTGQPDFGRIHICYVPDRLCVESKSLKLYLFAYRNHGAFHEDCVNRIADDLVKAIAPKYLRVFGEFNVRGGIAIKPLALRTAARSADEEHRYLSLVTHYDSVTKTGAPSPETL
jgi:7-cyano-7-deazaguanine reductase